MSAFSDYLEEKLCEWAMKQTAMPAAPANLYIALHYNDPEGDGNSELHDTGDTDGESPGYTRVAYATDVNNATHTQWTDPAADAGGFSSTNVLEIAFPTPTGAWNQAAATSTSRAIKWFGVWDALTNGNFLYGGEVLPSGIGVTVENGQDVSFGPNKLKIRHS